MRHSVAGSVGSIHGVVQLNRSRYVSRAMPKSHKVEVKEVKEGRAHSLGSRDDTLEVKSHC